MIDINKIVRKNILNLKPYSSARDEFSGEAGVFLDANENPFGELNRYPDPYQKELKRKLSKINSIEEDKIFIGNGSDEVIDLAFRIFCEPGKDKAIIFSPTYGMYNVSAAINNVRLLDIPLNSSFQIDIEKVRPHLIDKTIKLIFVCSPNNPTGNLMNKSDVEFLLSNFNGIVIVDEAYIDFASNASFLSLLKNYNNLIVSQTMSKAWGLASIRIGIVYTNKQILKLFNKVKPPYNVSVLNQNVALKSLKNTRFYKQNLSIILSEKKKLKNELLKLSVVKKIHSSDANFFLVEVRNAYEVYKFLVTRKIIIRNRTKQVKDCIRISVGTPEENKLLIQTLKEIQ